VPAARPEDRHPGALALAFERVIACVGLSLGLDLPAQDHRRGKDNYGKDERWTSSPRERNGNRLAVRLKYQSVPGTADEKAALSSAQLATLPLAVGVMCYGGAGFHQGALQGCARARGPRTQSPARDWLTVFSRLAKCTGLWIHFLRTSTSRP